MTRSFAYLVRTASPIGRLEITSDDKSITSLAIERMGQLPHDDHPERSSSVLDAAVWQLDEYFGGSRQQFDLPLALDGTAFQLDVWQRLSRIGWGEYTSYGEIGDEIGRPGSGRAIGGAVGSNPVPIIIGCHRVLSRQGRVTGYSGGEGIPTKLWLLEHEGIMLAA